MKTRPRFKEYIKSLSEEDLRMLFDDVSKEIDTVKNELDQLYKTRRSIVFEANNRTKPTPP